MTWLGADQKPSKEATLLSSGIDRQAGQSHLLKALLGAGATATRPAATATAATPSPTLRASFFMVLPKEQMSRTGTSCTKCPDKGTPGPGGLVI